jgi:metal-responsive CopG/Arc/MetJ family transcriptional regulator
VLEKKKLVISSKKYKGETTVISARLPMDMVRELDRIGERTGRNRNEIITLCLEYAIDNIATQDENSKG